MRQFEASLALNSMLKGWIGLSLDVTGQPQDRTIMRKLGLTLLLTLPGLLSSPWMRS